MKILTRMTVLAALVLAVPAAAHAQAGGVAADPAPRVIFFIGDGVGTAYWSAARLAAGPLAVERLPVVGLVDTRNADGRITDSAAGATVYATGRRTYNGAIGVGPDSATLPTVLERARQRGMATGLVATSSITHATPASFAAHVPSRQMEPEIARQLVEAAPNVLLGGGRGFFDGTLRSDGRDLMPDVRRRYAYVDDVALLDDVSAADTVARLAGFFAENGLPPAAQRASALPEMTRAALAVLDRDADGFFLMVEASQPDWRGHANQPLDAVVAEMLELDAAIAAALEYQARNPETLIVVTADHETGGLALETDSAGEYVADYTSDYHTGSMVPLFAGGPGADRFSGVLDNTRVGELLLESVAAPAVPASNDGR